MTKCLGAIEMFEDEKAGLIVENSEDGIYRGILNILNDRKRLDEYCKYLELDKYVKVEQRINDIMGIFKCEKEENRDEKQFDSLR